MTESIPLSPEVVLVRERTKVDLVTRMVAIKAEQERLDEEYKQLRSVLVSLIPEGQTSVGSTKVKVAKTFRFNPTLAEKRLPPERLALISSMTPQASLARKLLSSDEFALCVGDPTYTLTLS